MKLLHQLTQGSLWILMACTQSGVLVALLEMKSEHMKWKHSGKWKHFSIF